MSDDPELEARMLLRWDAVRNASYPAALRFTLLTFVMPIIIVLAIVGLVLALGLCQ